MNKKVVVHVTAALNIFLNKHRLACLQTLGLLCPDSKNQPITHRWTVGLAIWISPKPWYCFSASCFHLHVDLWLPGDRCVRGKHLPGRPEVAPCQRLSGSGSVQGLHSGAHGISGRDGGEVRARMSKHARQTIRWTNGKPRWGQVTGLDVTSASEHEDICIFQGWAVSRSSHAFDDSSQRGRRAFYLLRRLKYHEPIFQARLQRDTQKDSKVKSLNLDWSCFNLERPVWRMTPLQLRTIPLL